MSPSEKWVAALRSGKYKQGFSYLRVGDNYCCLGVACELYKEEHDLDVEITDGICTYGGMYGVLPPQVQEWLGLRDCLGAFEGDSLSKLNDDDKTFAEIADVIESKPRGLYADSNS